MAKRKKSKTELYWERRKAEEAYEMYREVEDRGEEMRHLYIWAKNETSDQVYKLVNKFSMKHGITRTEAVKLLKRLPDISDVKKLDALIKANPGNKQFLMEYEALSYSSRIREVVATQKKIDNIVGKLYRDAKFGIQETLESVAKGTFTHDMYDFQVMAGEAFPFDIPDEEVLLRFVDKRWTGASFSERLWYDTEALAEEVKLQMVIALLTGKSQREIAKDIQFCFSSSYKDALRLVRTESCYVSNQVQLWNYEKLGVKEYMYTAVLDQRTSEVCRSLDGRRFKVKNAKVGYNYPPMHPWCRSTTVAALPEPLLKKLKRSARDFWGKEVKIPATMKYKAWYNKFIKSDLMEKRRKELERKKAERERLKKEIAAKKAAGLKATKYTVRPKTLEGLLVKQDEWVNTHYKYWTKEEKETVRSKLQNMFDQSSFNMQIKTSNLEKVLDEGRFKNQFETNTSGGALSPRYRQMASKHYFGIDPMKMQDREYEKYGYLGYDNYLENESLSGRTIWYGDATVVFKKANLKDRVTYTYADSLDNMGGPFRAGTDGDNVSIAGLLDDQYYTPDLLDDYVGKSIDVEDVIANFNSSYLELQYHGDVFVEDIDKVIFTRGDEPSKDIVKKLKDKGIKVYWRNDEL